MKNKNKEVFTIGHSNHSVETFVKFLKYTMCPQLPMFVPRPTKYSPQYNKDRLKKTLEGNGLKYVFLGRELGARRDEDNCYENGQAVYHLIKDLPLFRKGIERLLQGIESYKLVIMCAEKKT